jgi:hypothetical protein
MGQLSTTLAGPAKNIKATPKPTIRLNLQASAEIKHVQRRKKAIRAAMSGQSIAPAGMKARLTGVSSTLASQIPCAIRTNGRVMEYVRSGNRSTVAPPVAPTIEPPMSTDWAL